VLDAVPARVVYRSSVGHSYLYTYNRRSFFNFTSSCSGRS
jgi:hypothetical protein